MKTAKKALLLTVCALVLVAAAVMGTLAYLSDTDEVANTFTVGKIDITLDEAKSSPEGMPMKGNAVTTKWDDADRVKGNTYHLVPGCVYHKDPVVWVEPGSEKSILYVTVDNQMAPAVEQKFLDDQITKYGWKELKTMVPDPDSGLAFTEDTVTKDGVKVYYKLADANKTDAAKDNIVFSSIRVDMNADEDLLNRVKDNKIIVKAYAVQQAGWSDPTSPVVSALKGDELAFLAWDGSFGGHTVMK